MNMPRPQKNRVHTAPGENRMRRPATTAAAVTLTAIGLALSAPLQTVAQEPIDLIGIGSDVSIRTSGESSQAGYFVGADGSIQYRDSAGIAGGQAVTATPITEFETTAPDLMVPDAMLSDAMLPDALTSDTMANDIISAPVAADIFDATPIAPADPVTLESLQDVFNTHSQPNVGQVGIETVTIDASAPVGGTVGGYYGDDGYRIENGTIVSTSDIPSAPVIGETVETYEVKITPPPMQEALAPLAPVLPSYEHPVSVETHTAGPIMTDPIDTGAYTSLPFTAEPIVSAPSYLDSAPVTVSTVAHEPIVDHYASLDPTPLPLSGRDFSARNGDGAYGPSTIKRAGEGPAGQETAVFITKSTIVELPIDAHEVLVADPSRVRAVLRTARQMVLIGLQPGQTNVTAFDEDGKQILNLDANIRYDLRPLNRALASTFPGTPVEIESVLGEIVVKGTVQNANEAGAIRDLVRRYLFSAMLGAGLSVNIEDVAFVDRLTVTSDDQILVKVRIAEMRRSVVKQFGVDFNLASDAALSAATGGLAQNLTDFGSITNAFGVNGAALGGIAANIAGSFGSTNFGALVRAFEQHSVMRVLAEPTLTAVSGETASFLAGGQFPFPTSVDDGDIGFSFRDFGVALEFTPVVVAPGRISLTVATEISELTTEGSLSAGDIQIPGISIRKANTTVELPSGGTMSIAGMLLQRDANAHTGLPGLKNLPVLGQLFSSSDYQKQETELVILVTPYIVKPGQEKDFRLPTDGFAPASDFDFFVLGRLHKVYGTGDPHTASAKEALQAPFGFILE